MVSMRERKEMCEKGVCFGRIGVQRALLVRGVRGGLISVFKVTRNPTDSLNFPYTFHNEE